MRCPTGGWTQNVCKKDTADEQNFGVGSIRFPPLQKCIELAKIFKEKNRKEGTLVVCSGDIEEAFIGSMVDGSGL
jgi:hypothetical protein